MEARFARKDLCISEKRRDGSSLRSQGFLCQDGGSLRSQGLVTHCRHLKPSSAPPFSGARNLFGFMHQARIWDLEGRIGKFWVPESRFSTTYFRTRFAALRSVTQSRDGPSSRVLSHILRVWIHGESLQNEPLAQKWRSEVGRIFVWISCLRKTLKFFSGRLVGHSDLPMHITGYSVPYYFRRLELFVL